MSSSSSSGWVWGDSRASNRVWAINNSNQVPFEVYLTAHGCICGDGPSDRCPAHGAEVRRFYEEEEAARRETEVDRSVPWIHNMMASLVDAETVSFRQVDEDMESS